MKAIKIVILLSVPDGCEVEVRTGSPEPLPPVASDVARPSQAEPDAYPEPDPYPARGQRPEREVGPADAILALRAFGIEHPERLVARYATERILAVCRHAEDRRDMLKNPAAWVVSALQRNWTIPRKGR